MKDYKAGMTAHFKLPESVLIIICTVDQHVLLMERLHPEQFWQSVTGSLETGEVPQQTAERELFEETGLAAGKEDIEVLYAGIQNIYPIHPAWRHRYHEDIQYNKENVFVVRLKSTCDILFNINEHREYRWLDKQQALTLCSSITNTRAIELLV